MLTFARGCSAFYECEGSFKKHFKATLTLNIAVMEEFFVVNVKS